MPAVRTLKINRFTVMAMLQAARARCLGLPEEAAYSWGLNRAIWYAAAKKGFSGGGGGSGAGGGGQAGGGSKAKPGKEYHLRDDLAYRDPNSSKLLFTLGGEVQTAEEFRAKIASRFGDQAGFRKAWKEAVAIVSEAGEDLLKSGPVFYSQVYKPRRDDLVKKWAAEFATSREANESG